MTLENKPGIGNGIYTIKDVANIIGLPYTKVKHWINEYWDGRLGKSFKGKYSWHVDNVQAIGFHSLVELYVMMQFAEAGVTAPKVLKAHKELSEAFGTIFPFAQKQIIDNIQTDGKMIYFHLDEETTMSLDGSKQLNLEFIKLFFRKLEFNNELLASRLWPIGKDKAVVCDPHHKFGQPVIDGTNIQTEAIYKMYLAKEPIPFIANLYEIPEQKVKDAISFHKHAA